MQECNTRNRHKASIVRSHSAGGLEIFVSLPPKSPRIWRPLARQRDLIVDKVRSLLNGNIVTNSF
jgi:hypothetical protein